jgi:DUF4097 and DUF4098 domain-containing protein YvlB
VKAIAIGTALAVVLLYDRGAVAAAAPHVYVDESGCRDSHGNADGNRTQIHYVVAVPAGVALVCKNVDGSVRVRGVAGAVTATTVNGDVTSESGGSVSAQTVDGKIDVTARASGDRPIALKAVNGRVGLRLQPASGARISVSTINGSIDGGGAFSFAERGGSIVGHTASGRIGDGSGSVSISTVNGDVRVSAS